MNGSSLPDIQIRAVLDLAGFESCVQLQIAVWGLNDGDVVPRRSFLLAHHIGGQVIGAYSEERLIGFAMALPGYRRGQSYMHSHMLAVLPEFRNAGIGRRLKLAQRDDALGRGIALMEWTFDPLEIRNAYLNLTRLGVIVRRYEPNFYGYTSSALQAGLPTDRLLAEWWMGSARVARVLAGRESNRDEVVDRVTVAGQIARWKTADRARALAEQERLRNALMEAFGRNLVASGFDRGPDGCGTYLLTTAADTSE